MSVSKTRKVSLIVMLLTFCAIGSIAASLHTKAKLTTWTPWFQDVLNLNPTPDEDINYHEDFYAYTGQAREDSVYPAYADEYDFDYMWKDAGKFLAVRGVNYENFSIRIYYSFRFME